MARLSYLESAGSIRSNRYSDHYHGELTGQIIQDQTHQPVSIVSADVLSIG